MGTFSAKVDLHLHSRASSLQTAWYNRLFNCPESFTDPKEIYKRLKSRGMSFITITDHDTIDGVLEIADQPEVFISCEYTVSVPEEHAKIHVLVFGLDEGHHQDLLKIRDNLYDFVSYLRDRDLAFSLAHPLYSVEGTKITKSLVERMVLLFDTWEGINGTRGDGVRYVEETIARHYAGWEIIYDLANKYNIEPLRQRDRISFTAGSDDHGGLDVGRTWTAVDDAKTIEDFLQGIKEGRTKIGTESLGEERILRTLLRIAFEYAKNKNYLPTEVATVLDFTFKNPDHALALGLVESILGEDVSDRSFREIIKNLPQLTLAKLWRNSSPKNLGEVFLALLVHAISALVKYAQKREEERIKRLAQSLGLINGKPPKVAYIVDTYPYVNGVSRSSEIIREIAFKYDLPVYLLICHSEKIEAERLFRLQPLFEIPTPFYEEMKLGIPNLMEMLELLENKGFTQIHIATPGPLGILGLVAGKILGLKITSTYHTDLPTYARVYTLDEEVENMVWKVMKMITNLTDRFFVPSDYYRNLLISKGINPEKLNVFRRGVDTSTFSPKWRDRTYLKWHYGIGEDCQVVLYVGRVSEEKNLDTFLYVANKLPKTAFVIVGDGPYRKNLEDKAPENVYFLGYKGGEDLSKIYASADIFLFPSETETYGLAVLEAMASGLPVVVSNKGATKEHVIDEVNGFIAEDPEDFLLKISHLLHNKDMRIRMGERARESIQGLDLIESYKAYLHAIMAPG
ncbi:MAG: glycosyltransferase [Caldimicrobium sp.]|nr:glycosyltransferase [Caldimicrobium sp.]MCX7613054.1 glycosyltransferase [Caldimicrobium sp.]MDW8182795.1 glycosyltransferase [Caldimicrobium sp.]